MTNIMYVLGFIIVAVGLVIGILIYSEIEKSVECPSVETDIEINKSCTREKSIAWTVISILPIALFFALFTIFGSIMGFETTHTTKTKSKTTIMKRILLYIGLAKFK